MYMAQSSIGFRPKNMILHLNIYAYTYSEWGDLRNGDLLQANSIMTPPLPVAIASMYEYTV